MNPSQIVSGDTESSAVVQWQRPEETGGRGINISSYTVTVCNITGHQMSESVPDDDRENGTFTHTITGLTYNTTYTVKVTTINSCGLASQSSPINIIIEAEGQFSAIALWWYGSMTSQPFTMMKDFIIIAIVLIFDEEK